METIEYIFCCVFIGILTLAFVLAAIYGLMLYVRLIINTVKKWRAEDGNKN